MINDLLLSRGFKPGEQAAAPSRPSTRQDPKKNFVFASKDDARAAKSFRKGLELFNKDRKGALKCFNDAVRFGSLKSRFFEKRAELFFLDKRFYECSRDVDVVLASPVPSESVNALLALKTKSLLKLGCPNMALSFIRVARKCWKDADFSNNGRLERLKKLAKRRVKKTAVDGDETSRLCSLFPDREEMLRRVRRWTPKDGKKIGGATVSAALELRVEWGDVNFVAVRDIAAGMFGGRLETVTLDSGQDNEAIYSELKGNFVVGDKVFNFLPPSFQNVSMSLTNWSYSRVPVTISSPNLNWQ
jgi:hypothetical protein